MQKTHNENQEMIPIEEAVSELGTIKRKMLIHINDGLLIAEKIDGEWFITRQSLEAFKLKQLGKRNNNCKREDCPSSSCVGCN